MNVYQVCEDGERRLFAAENYAAAIAAAFAQYEHDETKDTDQPSWTPAQRAEQRRDWERTILESITHVGELENPTLVAAFACRIASGEIAAVTLEDVRAFLIAIEATGTVKLVDVTDGDLGPLQALLETFLIDHATEPDA